MGGSVSETEPPSQWRFCPELLLFTVHLSWLRPHALPLHLCSSTLLWLRLHHSPLSPGLTPPSLPRLATPLFLYLIFLMIHLQRASWISLVSTWPPSISGLCLKDLTLQLRQPVSDVHILLSSSHSFDLTHSRAVKTNFTKPHLACVTTLLRMKTGSQLPP